MYPGGPPFCCFPSTHWALPVAMTWHLERPDKAAKPGSPGSNSPPILQSVCLPPHHPQAMAEEKDMVNARSMWLLLGQAQQHTFGTSFQNLSTARQQPLFSS